MHSTNELTRTIEDFKKLPEKSISALDAAQGEGKLVVGVYCIYAPSELIRATGSVPVGLCGKRQTPIEAAERDLPASFCPLIKSSYGYGITDTCPFFSISDVLCAESTCDGKKKMYELMAKLKPMHVMQLPHTQDGKAPREYWIQALHHLENFLEEHGAHRASIDDLRQQIRQHNIMRRKASEVLLLAADRRSPLSGQEFLAIQESKGFIANMEEYLDLLDTLAQGLREHIAQPDVPSHQGVRLMLTGVPIGKGSDKVIRIIEELGARVLCMENCTGSKGLGLFVDEEKDPMEALAERYLRTPCSCMSPNPGRRTNLEALGREYEVQGVVDLTWLGCHTYNAESLTVRRWVEEDLGLPTLHLETDYSDADVEQLRTRIEAYLELIA